jgi:hypothetical protein
MMIIGCDLHTRYQQVALLDTETGELVERRLEHERRVGHFNWESITRVCLSTLTHPSQSQNQRRKRP